MKKYIVDLKKIYYELKREICEFWELDDLGIDLGEDAYYDMAKKSHLKNELEIFFNKIGCDY